MQRISARSRGAVTVAGLAALLVAVAAFAAAAQPPPGSAPGHRCKSPCVAPGMGPGAPGPGCDMHRGGRGMRHAGMRHGGATGGGCAERLLGAAEKLELTDTQKTELGEIRRRTPAALMPKRQAIIEARMDLQDLMQKPAATASELRKAHDKLLKARTDLQAATFDLRMQAREVLTPEQREKLHKEMGRCCDAGGGPGWLGDSGFGSLDPFGDEPMFAGDEPLPPDMPLPPCAPPAGGELEAR